jgi:tetratricopeptide (TPR) repeat protein
MMPDAGARDRVFISYSHKDARWLQRVQVHFSPFERQGKIQRWDDTMITPGKKWRDEISLALTCAKVAVLLVSADFLASDFIANEELPRLLSAAENDGVVIVPVILSPCAFNSVETLSQFQSINPPSQPLSGLSKTKREQLLVKLTEVIESLLSPQSAAPGTVATASGRLCGVPARNPLFCGRESLLDQIGQAVNESRRAALCGLAGIGKTETAIEYVYRNRQRYSLVVWIKADSRQQLHASFIAAARFLELPEWNNPDQTLALAAMFHWFTRHTGWLAVFDDVDDLDLAKEFLPDSENGHLLITTRMQATTAIAGPLEVEPLNLEEGVGLLLRRGKILNSQADLNKLAISDYTAAKTIAGEMGCLPMALDQAGAYLEETGCGAETYLALWSTNRPKLLAQRPTSSLRNSESVAATWLFSFSELEKSKPQAIDLLKVMAFLHPDAIPEEVLSAGSDLLGPELAAVVGDPWQLNEVIREAIKFSLLRRDAKSRALRMHRLFQAVLRDSMDQATQASWAERAVRVIEHGFPEAKFANWERCAKLVAHAQVCAETIKTWRLSAPYSARLLHELGYYLYQRGRYHEAAGFLETGLSMRQELCGNEHPDYARTLDVNGQLLQAQGKLSEAEASFRAAADMLQNTLGPEHEETARVIGHLAALKLEQRQLADAKSLFLKALAIAQQALGPEHSSVAQIVNNLAAVFFEQGNYAEAESMFERALAIREKILPAQHPSIAQAYNNLAAVCSRQGRYADAARLYNKALSIREASLGPDHPHVAETLYNLALLYLKQRDGKQAEPHLKRALAIREASQGTDHPSTAEVLASLAELRRSQGALDQAEALYERALHIQETALGKEHPSVGYSLLGLAETNQVRGNNEKAESTLRRALDILERGLGPGHPDVIDCRAKLSNQLLAQGRADAETTPKTQTDEQDGARSKNVRST